MQGLSLCLSEFEMLCQKVDSTFDAIAFGFELCEHYRHDKLFSTNRARLYRSRADVEFVEIYETPIAPSR